MKFVSSKFIHSFPNNDSYSTMTIVYNFLQFGKPFRCTLVQNLVNDCNTRRSTTKVLYFLSGKIQMQLKASIISVVGLQNFRDFSQ